jgi:hypothetical protein
MPTKGQQLEIQFWREEILGQILLEKGQKAS